MRMHRHMHALVVIDKVAVGHEGQGLAVAVAALGGRDDGVVDQPRQEGRACGGREAHVRHLHGERCVPHVCCARKCVCVCACMYVFGVYAKHVCACMSSAL